MTEKLEKPARPEKGAAVKVRAYMLLQRYRDDESDTGWIAFAKRAGVYYSTLMRWGDHYSWSKDWKAEVSALQARNAERRGDNRQTAVLSEELSQQSRYWPFLDAYRKSGKRLAACEEVGLTWAQVRQGLRVNHDFQKRYNEVREEFWADVEDEHVLAARSGDKGAAARILSANVERYGRAAGRLPDGAPEGSKSGASKEEDWLAATLRASRKKAPYAPPEEEPYDEEEDADAGLESN